MTFDVTALNAIRPNPSWQTAAEAFSVCRNCAQSTTFILRAKTPELATFLKIRLDGRPIPHELGQITFVAGYISAKDFATLRTPDHLPDSLALIFDEGARCLAIGCWNASAVMFRLCLDIATKPLLPDPDDQTAQQPNKGQRRDLGLRVPWLLDQGRLPAGLRDIASCIREDGNDGAHAGSLNESDALDVADFTVALLERLYTEPENLRRASARRNERRKQAQGDGG